MRKTLIATHLKTILLAGVIIVAAAGCGTISTAPDQVGLEYKGGPLSATRFDRCVGASTRDIQAPGDTNVVLPAGQRTFDFSGAHGSDSSPIGVVSKDNVSMTVSGVATFSLNVRCEVLRSFWERIGRKYHVDGDDGWVAMLNTYFKQPLDRAMDQEAKKYDWQQLYTSADVKEQWEAAVGALAVRLVAEQAGGQFFCGPNYTGTGACGSFALTLQNPVPPQNIIDANNANEAQKKLNAAVTTELQSLQALVKVLGPQGAILYQAIKSKQVQIVPVPAGSAVNIQPKP